MIKKTLLVRMLSSSRRFVAATSITCVFLLLLASPAFAVAGDLDTSFDGDGKVTTAISSGSDIGNAVVQQPDEKLVVAGRCSNGSNFDFCLARYINDGVSDGTLDTSFGTGGRVITPIGSGQDWGNAVTTQIVAGEVRIIVAGRAHNGTNYDFALARYTSTGALDTTFDIDGIKTEPVGTKDDMIFGVVAETDGDITVTGATLDNDGDFDAALARFNLDGSLDTGFGVGTGGGPGGGFTRTDLSRNNKNDVAQELVLDSIGRIVIAGYAGVIGAGTGADVAVARYSSLGVLDSTFGGVTFAGRVLTNAAALITNNNRKDDFALDLAIYPQTDPTVANRGRILLAGAVNVNTTGPTGSNQKYNFLLVRYNSDGTSPAVFHTDFGLTQDQAAGVSIDSAGLAVVGGSANGTADAQGKPSPLSNFNFGVARYDSALALDPTFSGDGKQTTDIGGTSKADYGNDLIIQSDNKIVLAGQCVVSNYDFCAARYLST